MALKLWLASLKADVSNVSGVQAPIHAGFGRYVTETADVSGVSGRGGMMASDTADTAVEKQTYQAKPAWALAFFPVIPNVFQRAEVALKAGPSRAD